MLARYGSRKAWLLLLFGASVLYSISELYRQRNPFSTPRREESSQDVPPMGPRGPEPEHSRCDLYPDEGDIAVSVKTGATEAFKKLPAILGTSLSCVRDVMVFSDLEQTLGDVHIHDALARFSPEAMESEPDFELYRKQKEFVSLHKEGEIESLSSMLAPPRDWQTKGKSASWGLDKYKFLHMLEMAYEMQPDRDWYVFLEADTYLSWPSLKRWLATLDPRHNLYIGHSLQKDDSKPPKFFAHGGAGFVLSGAALKQFAVDREGVARRKDIHVHKWWAGDMMLADVLYSELGIEVTQAAPMFNQLGSREISFTDMLWCQPLITLHHMTAQDFQEIYQKETQMAPSPMLLRDICPTVYPEGLPGMREDWDNMSDDLQHVLDPKLTTALVDAHSSFENCRIVCEANRRCVQFFFRNTTMMKSGEPGFEYLPQCVISSAFRLGHSKPSQAFHNLDEDRVARTWTSGWQTERINKWIADHWKCLSDDLEALP